MDSVFGAGGGALPGRGENRGDKREKREELFCCGDDCAKTGVISPQRRRGRKDRGDVSFVSERPTNENPSCLRETTIMLLQRFAETGLSGHLLPADGRSIRVPRRALE